MKNPETKHFKASSFFTDPFHRKRLETVLWMLTYAREAIERGEQPWDVILAAHNIVETHLDKMNELSADAFNRHLHGEDRHE